MIPQIKRILYATDLTKNSAYAFFYAVDMAKSITQPLSSCTPLNPFLIYYSEGSLLTVKRCWKEAKKQEQEMDLRKSKKASRNFVREQRLKLALHALNWYPKSSFPWATRWKRF